jgi:transposase-like protein
MYERAETVTGVAVELNVAFETARRWLLAAGVQLLPKGRPSASARQLDVGELAKRYSTGESIAQLGRRYGVSPATVRSRLLDAGVELRPRPGWKY